MCAYLEFLVHSIKSNRYEGVNDHMNCFNLRLLVEISIDHNVQNLRLQLHHRGAH